MQNKKTVITRGSHDARMMSPKPAANMQMIAPSVKHSLDKSDRMGRATTKVTTIFNKIPPNDSRGVKKIE